MIKETKTLKSQKMQDSKALNQATGNMALVLESLPLLQAKKAHQNVVVPPLLPVVPFPASDLSVINESREMQSEVFFRYLQAAARKHERVQKTMVKLYVEPDPDAVSALYMILFMNAGAIRGVRMASSLMAGNNDGGGENELARKLGAVMEAANTQIVGNAFATMARMMLRCMIASGECDDVIMVPIKEATMAVAEVTCGWGMFSVAKKLMSGASEEDKAAWSERYFIHIG